MAGGADVLAEVSFVLVNEQKSNAIAQIILEEVEVEGVEGVGEGKKVAEKAPDARETVKRSVQKEG